MTLDQIIAKYQEVYYIEDTSAIALVCAVVLSSKTAGDPIWLMLVGASSSGKTEMLNAISGAVDVHEIAMLTTNTFLSGMKPSKGKETSLLLKINRNSILLHRDFTTILSMNKDDQQALMAQLRQVYDGNFVKDTGTGDSLVWKGKITLLAAVTEKIHVLESKFSGMGTRAIQYTLPAQDRMATTRRAAKIAKNIKASREEIKSYFNGYLNEMMPIVMAAQFEVPVEISENILKVCDVAAVARSPVERDFRGRMELVLSPEMPMRMSNQLHQLGATFMAMEGGVLKKEHEAILYKIAFDSIPKGRRLALRELAAHSYITSKACAIALNYETERVRMWLEELNVLGICTREIKGKGNEGDKWSLKEEYKEIVGLFDKIKNTGEALETADADAEDTMDEWGGF